MNKLERDVLNIREVAEENVSAPIEREKEMMKTTMRKRERRESVVVVLEGIKVSSRDEKGVAPLSWAMRNAISCNGDLLVLIILNPSIYNADSSSLGSNKVNFKCLHQQIRERRDTFRQALRPFYDRCKISGIKFEAKVASGFRPRTIVREEANNVKATWVVMDRSLVGDLSFRLRSEDRVIVIVDENEEVEVQKPPLSNGLEIPIVRKENTKPKSPKNPNSKLSRLLNVSLPHERSHTHNSSPALVDSSVLHDRMDASISTIENSKPTTRKLSKELIPNEKPHICPSFPVPGSPNLEKMQVEKEIEAEQSSKLTNECDYVPMTSKLEDVPHFTKMHWEKEIKVEPQKTSECDPVTMTSERGDVSWRRNLELKHVLKQPMELSWEEIVLITDGFQACSCNCRNEMFEIYKGRLHDPASIKVMVKRFSSDFKRMIEAEKRVSSLMPHQNILVPIAYHEGLETSALVYPYEGNGSLDQFLTRLIGNETGLSSAERMNIAIGIGRGVRYMHEECPGGPVIHGDLRACNIFLGCDYQPLITGFGQARWLKMEQMMMVENINRCWHEVPSDSDSILLIKSDVLAFGILLLRLFCQQPMPEDDIQLVNWARPLLMQCAFHEMLDQELEDLDMYAMYRVMSAATQCTKPKPLSRPSMTQVLAILRGDNSCTQSPPSSESSVGTATDHFF